MKKWFERLKEYDKMLGCKKNLDGSMEIYRQSPFSGERQFTVLTIKNQLPGNWIIDKLMKMDAQRIDMVTGVIQNNERIRRRGEDDRITREIAEMFDTGGSIFVN